MYPGDEKEEKLASHHIFRRQHPHLVQDAVVAELHLIQRCAHANDARVLDEQQWNGEPQRELPCFPRGYSQVPPAVKCVEAKQRMSHERSVEEAQTWKSLPRHDEIASRLVHRIDGADSESLTEEV